MIKKDSSGVSPVIATILMVAITVVMSSVLVVMVFGMIENSDPAPLAILDVKPVFNVEDGYEVFVKAMTFSLSTSQIVLSINGEKSQSTLDGHSPSNPFQGQSFSCHPVTQSSTFGTGSTLRLNIEPALRGSEVSLQLLRQDGALIGRISFNTLGESQQSTLNMTGAKWNNNENAVFPLVFDSSERRFVTIPRDNIDTPVTYLRIEAKVVLHSPSNQQIAHATIVNINGDNGYRLQISSGYFTFGAGGSSNWVRSNGMGSAPHSVYPQANVMYTVWGVMDFEASSISVWVNNTEGIMVKAGERTGVTGLPNMGLRDWTIGAWWDNQRYFHGEVHSVNIVAY